jgi:hypothetical protein
MERRTLLHWPFLLMLARGYRVTDRALHSAMFGVLCIASLGASVGDTLLFLLFPYTAVAPCLATLVVSVECTTASEVHRVLCGESLGVLLYSDRFTLTAPPPDLQGPRDVVLRDAVASLGDTAGRLYQEADVAGALAECVKVQLPQNRTWR